MKAVLTEPDQTRHVECAVVMVTHNSARDVTGLLDCLATSAGDLTLRVIVVDTGSADFTFERVRDDPESSFPIKSVAIPAYNGSVVI
jgi:GT2 family glycosyltransferase